jgi:predicted nucleic acid-binding protein
MTRFLLDTTFIIDVLNDQRKRLAVMKDLIAQRHELACCAINVAEVYAACAQRKPKRPRSCCAASTMCR